MRPIRIAAQLHPQHGDYPTCARAVLRAEELGYDIAYTWDHFFPLYGEPDGAHFECWSLLAALAEATRAHRARAARRVQLVPQPEPARRHRPDGRPHQRRPVDPRPRSGLVRARLRRVRLRVRHGRHPADGPRARAARHASTGSSCSTRRRVRKMPILIAGTGERRTLAPRRRARRRLARGLPGSARASSSRRSPPCAVVRRDRPGPGRRSSGASASSPRISIASWPRTRDTYVEMGFSQFTLGFNGPAGPSRGRAVARLARWSQSIAVTRGRHRGLGRREPGRPDTPCPTTFPAAPGRVAVVQDQPANSPKGSENDERTDGEQRPRPLKEFQRRPPNDRAEQEMATDEQAVTDHQAGQETRQRQRSEATRGYRRHAYAWRRPGDRDAAWATALKSVGSVARSSSVRRRSGRAGRSWRDAARREPGGTGWRRQRSRRRGSR